MPQVNDPKICHVPMAQAHRLGLVRERISSDARDHGHLMVEARYINLDHWSWALRPDAWCHWVR